jgi:hypothetical protein
MEDRQPIGCPFFAQCGALFIQSFLVVSLALMDLLYSWRNVKKTQTLRLLLLFKLLLFLSSTYILPQVLFMPKSVDEGPRFQTFFFTLETHRTIASSMLGFLAEHLLPRQ